MALIDPVNNHLYKSRFLIPEIFFGTGRLINYTQLVTVAQSMKKIKHCFLRHCNILDTIQQNKQTARSLIIMLRMSGCIVFLQAISSFPLEVVYS